ncbi:MAG: 4Fe-4S cluster-binding domain-containing protein [Clostridia bacterium]|nr:4Fe-4S cluster-binding domain-containing protein [Clostridia bacterium]
MSNPYKTREGGATVTVFVPYDCGNNCPFCVNKKEYADMTGFSVEAICRSIRVMDAITPYCDFVFTGGEPFANLASLQVMLDHIPATHKIYINTTLPLLNGVTEDDILAFAGKNKDKITCINVSRHLVKYVVESDDSLIARMPVPVRVNCVLFRDYPKERLVPYIRRIGALGCTIQFRFDYTDTTPENLYDREHDPIFRDLCRVARYTGLDGCRMRCGFHFDYHGIEMTYHKTLPYSTIVETGDDGVTYDILYDILIKQNGELHSDWTGVKLDVEAYRKAVFEPYDLRWIEKV